MGDECTRGCRFCSVKTSRAPKPLDANEPENTAEAIFKWGLDYVVLTSVDRDGMICATMIILFFYLLDLIDGGASHFADTIRRIKSKNSKIMVETLTGDFQGNTKNVAEVVDAGQEVFAHNLETVERLTPSIRDRRATYGQSLKVLDFAKSRKPSLLTKSSLMVGCGEEDSEIVQSMKDLRLAGVDFLTIGQYMRPTKRHMKVDSYIHPEKFEEYRKIGEQLGFKYVASGPLVRSSYRAGELYITTLLNK
jgi:lipoic acid synthetase